MIDFEIAQVDKRRLLGQVMTPPSVARLMASMVSARGGTLRILDAGAGRGALSAAVLEQLRDSDQKPEGVHVETWEIDRSLEPSLRANLERCSRELSSLGIVVSYEIHTEDFLAAVAYERRVAGKHLTEGRFDLAILNPPYRKVRADSEARAAVCELGLDVSNLYAGFVAASIASLRLGGELVAITPRSFCNGPYFRDFRRFVFRNAPIDRMHVFESRTEAFSDAGVLQENVIYHAVRGSAMPSQVLVSRSIGPDSLVSSNTIAFSEFVDPSDLDLFIHLPDSETVADETPSVSLEDLGLEVSTGRVVDFRSRAFLRDEPQQDTVPLIYPSAFAGAVVSWPPRRRNKPVAIVRAGQTEKLLVPAGHYVLVRRMSSKEEPRRVVAAVIGPESVTAPAYAFENHLNYFHHEGKAIDPSLARGLTAYLNSEPVDRSIRRFNGHTQVNAADLRRLRYPTRNALMKLGMGASIGREEPVTANA